MAKHSLGRDDARPSIPTESPSFITTPVSATKTDNPAVRAAWDAVREAHDAIETWSSCIAHLEALFCAISAASGEHSLAGKLALLGGDLASDWADLHGRMRESLEPHVDAMRAALQIAREGRK